MNIHTLARMTACDQALIALADIADPLIERVTARSDISPEEGDDDVFDDIDQLERVLDAMTRLCLFGSAGAKAVARIYGNLTCVDTAPWDTYFKSQSDLLAHQIANFASLQGTLEDIETRVPVAA